MTKKAPIRLKIKEYYMVKPKISNSQVLKSFIYEKLLPDKKIKSALYVKYPSASDIEWSLKNNIFIVSFTNAGIYKEVSFDEKGFLKEEKTYFSERQLPINIVDTLYSKYNLLFLVSAFEVYRSGNIIFEIIFDSKDKSRYLIIFDKKGEILNEQLLVAVRKD